MNESQKSYIFSNFSELAQLKEYERLQMKRVAGRKPKNDIDGLHLVHLTRYFPTDGEIHPRQSLSFEIVESEEKKALLDCLSITRQTVHFTVNHSVKAHGVYGSFGVPTIAVIAPLSSVKDGVIGGYIEDIIFHGTFTIPAGSTILVSESRKNELSEAIAMLPYDITVKFFNSKIEDAVRYELLSKGAEYLDLDDMVDNKETEILIGKLGKSSYLSSRDLMKLLGRKLCQHQNSPFEIMENIFWICDGGVLDMKFIFNPRDWTLKPPFIQALDDCEDSIKRISSVFNRQCETVRKMSHVDRRASQFIEEWSDSVKAMMQLLIKHKTKDGFLMDYKKNGELITRFDYHFYCSLKEPTEEKTQVARLLSALTGLNFGSYYSSKRTSAVNAIAVLHEAFDQPYVDRVVSKLCSVFDLNFKLRVVEGVDCIVLNQANFAHVASKIFAKKDTKQIQF